MTSTSGFDPDGDVPEFLRGLPGRLEGKWVLVARLDSAPPSPYSPTIKDATWRFADQIEWTAAGLLIPGSRVEGILDQSRFFNGFDEVVSFDQKPIMVPPIEPRFTADEAAPDRVLAELGAYLERHGPVAAAGDGAGLVWIRRS
jgi:hypothetical protein